MTRGEGAELVPNEGDLWIGSVPGKPPAAAAISCGSFEGMISELALVRRTITDQDIQQMYQIGRPQQ